LRALLLACGAVFFCSTVLSAPADESFNLAGVGVGVMTRPYDGVHSETRGLPFLIAEYKDFYVKGLEAGYHFLKAAPLTLSVIAQPRLMGYSSADSSALSGMKDRRISLDAGLKAVYELPWHGLDATAKVLTDTLSRNQGSMYQLALARPIKGKIYRIIPSAGVRYDDANSVDYYYGVNDDEARAGRAAYAPRGAVDPFANVAITCGIAKRWIVIMLLDVESLGPEVRKSPIVDKSYVFSAAAGLTYRF
jgi:MipA family protein